MNLTQTIAKVRDQLDDGLSLKKWSDSEIVRHVDEQQKVMFRRMAKSGKEWSNFTYCLHSEAARQLANNIWEYRLPTWVENVVAVYRSTNGLGNETGFSPYLFAAAIPLDDSLAIIPKTDAKRRDGWLWEGQHTLRLWGETTASDLVVRCQALPPPVFKASIGTAYTGSPTTSGFYLPPALLLGEHHYEEGRYVNAEVQVTSTQTATSTNLGEVRRVVYSRGNAIVSSVRYNELRVVPNWNTLLEQNDIVETMLAVPAIHSRLLVLRVVNACAIKKFNLDLQRSIADELRREELEFSEYAEGPRDSTGPHFKIQGMRERPRYDPDRFSYGPNWNYW